MLGQAAGFDMTTPEGSERFIGLYNAAPAGREEKAGFAKIRGDHRKTKSAGKGKPGGKKKKKRRR